MRNALSREIRASLIKNFMNVSVLFRLDKASIGGYDVIKFFYEKYNLLFSPGTIYSCLYSLERNGLVKGIGNQNKRIYKLTDKGRVMLNAFRNDKEELLKFISDILK
jgi:DNA-binding PadR family transcriptional regulator